MRPIKIIDDTPIVLQKVRVGMDMIVTDNMLMDSQSEIVSDYVINGIRVSLRGYLLGEVVQHEEISYPRDWWEAFKERWFPKWAKIKWPVQYRKTVMDAKAIYPDFQPSLPNERHFIKISKYSLDV